VYYIKKLDKSDVGKIVAYSKDLDFMTIDCRNLSKRIMREIVFHSMKRPCGICANSLEKKKKIREIEVLLEKKYMLIDEGEIMKHDYSFRCSSVKHEDLVLMIKFNRKSVSVVNILKYSVNDSEGFSVKCRLSNIN